MRWTLGLVLLVGCATPIGVEPADTQQVHRTLTQSVLSTGEPSAYSLQVLRRLGLEEEFHRDPDSVLAVLHAGWVSEGDDARLFALAELCFLDDQDLAAAAYAWAFLFGEDGEGLPPAYDPRTRLAFDLYNRALTRGLTDPETGEVRLDGREVTAPFGALEVEALEGDAFWGSCPLVRFEPAAEVEVRGLRNRYRQAGIGAPLAAALEETGSPCRRWVLPRFRVPVTALLRFDAPERGLVAGRLHGRLELYTRHDDLAVEIDGTRVPLEFETTSSLAYGLEGSPIWDSELWGFFFGDFRLAGRRDGLLMLRPYVPGRIPLVLVHGTASSPARWAEMVNELDNDPRLWSRYQIWLYLYNTGNPILFSAARLREALDEAARTLDPGGSDPALRRMVVVGHSQGGLLAKLLVVESGDRFWRNLSGETFAEADLQPQTRALLERTLFFRPSPHVARVVFVATPHRGSWLAGFRLSRVFSGLIRLPVSISELTLDLATEGDDAILVRRIDRWPTSIDNMAPGNPFLKTLARLPVEVPAHSIIAVRGSGPPEQGGDGVVTYESAHLDGVASERVVRSGHSAQAQPETIEEVRRILLEHAGL
jgi:pimeloyl-ACP methyl ester carboxylesterase